MVTTYRYIGHKSMGFVGYEIQGAGFIRKARWQPPLEQLDVPTLDDNDDMPHDEPPLPLALATLSSAPMDIHTMYTSIMGYFDTWEGRSDHRFDIIDACLSTLKHSHRALME